MYLELSFDLGSLDPEAAEQVCFERGALAVTFMDARDDPVLEPGPGEFRLWPATRLVVLFAAGEDAGALRHLLAANLGVAPAGIHAQSVADRAWEREWLKDFHAMRFGERLWICPHHERVADPGAVVVHLDPGLAFGTGTHASTALCLVWLDAHAHLLRAPAEHSVERPAHGLDAHAHLLRAPAEHSVERPAHGLDAHAHLLRAPAEHSVERPAHGLDAHLAPGALVIDYGCGSGVLALAAAKLGAAAVHCFDIDPQALTATRDNALANGVARRVHLQSQADSLPHGADVLLANILSGPLCELAATFASLVRPGGQVVLAGLMDHEAADVTAAFAPCFHVGRFGDRDGWTCLAGRRN
jgi:ribosomal protein L11 methylase PrmA